jgi:hypothetical protein
MPDEWGWYAVAFRTIFGRSKFIRVRCRARSIGSVPVPASWSAPSNTPFAEPVTALPGRVVPRYGVRVTVMPRPPCAR